MRHLYPGVEIKNPDGSLLLRVGEYIDAGSFGLVYRAELASGENVAIKVLHVLPVPDAEGAIALNAELEAARKISHPNVVRILDAVIDRSDVPPLLIMELVEGGTLESFLERCSKDAAPLEFSAMRALMEGVVCGAEAINVVMWHRDIKLANILLTRHLVPKITDFGFSKVVGQLTRSLTFKGRQTPLYRAPEAWERHESSIAQDMYAVGVVLYEIATLQYPYALQRAADEVQVRKAHLFGPIQPVESFRPDLPLGVSRVILKMLSKLPEDRFATWNAVKLALDQAWKPTAPMPPSSAAAEILKELRRQDDDRKAASAAAAFASERWDRIVGASWAQLRELLENIGDAIDAFNESSDAGRLERTWQWGKGASGMVPPEVWDLSFSVLLPSKEAVSLQFRLLGDSIRVDEAYCQLVGCVTSLDRSWFNFFLLRPDEEDMYGRWVIGYVRKNALLGAELPFVPDGEFGLGIQQSDHMASINRGASMYQGRFEPANPEAVMKVVLSTLLAGGRGRR